MKFKATAPRRLTLWRLAPLFCAAFVCPITAIASSHSDAPLIKQDPQANLTDVYAFGTSENLVGSGPPGRGPAGELSTRFRCKNGS